MLTLACQPNCQSHMSGTAWPQSVLSELSRCGCRLTSSESARDQLPGMLLQRLRLTCLMIPAQLS